ncbi:nanoRNase/pAp phosphatase [Candidatus Termititenax persephonae]|uniref:NanoRNase/pAp phosphatase n=1 Tax=Candidatus Termititenax persephonae TaxID=2218525 RepID=A0A388TF27_9BACT|nr:nanoRNase/pAp phosphatase [Candidatus Termititenax persephonae]
MYNETMKRTVRLADLAQKIKNAQNILILTHVDPDGDALGSAYFLREIIRKLQAKARIAVLFDPQHKGELNAFIKRGDAGRCGRLKHPDLVVSVDASDSRRLYGAAGLPIDICLDHHVSSRRFAELNIIDPQAASCTLVIYDLLQAWKLKLTKTMAEYLYLGLASDTGNFAFANTDARVFGAAYACARLGVKPNAVYNKLNEQLTRREILDFAQAVSQTESFCRRRLSVVAVPKTLRVDNRFLIDFIRRDKFAEVAVVLVAKKDYIKISLRSKTALDVAKVAAHFHGGGHRKAAAGKIFKATLAEAKKQVVEYFRQQVF